MSLAPSCHACQSVHVSPTSISSPVLILVYTCTSLLLIMPVTVKHLNFLEAKMSTLSAISSNLVKRTIPFCSFSSAPAKAPPPVLLSYNPILPKNPTCLSAPLLANYDPGKSPPEFPKVPNDPPSVPPEVPQVPFTPEIDPSSTPAEVNTNPPEPNPGPEFPRTPVPPQPDRGPELPKPTIPPRPGPDIPLPKPDVVPPDPPDYVPPGGPAWPDILPPLPDISPPTGPYVL